MSETIGYRHVDHECPWCGHKWAANGNRPGGSICPKCGPKVMGAGHANPQGRIPPRTTGKVPHRCPSCNGWGTRARHRYGSIGDLESVPCRPCKGEGIVWGSR